MKDKRYNNDTTCTNNRPRRAAPTQEQKRVINDYCHGNLSFNSLLCSVQQLEVNLVLFLTIFLIALFVYVSSFVVCQLTLLRAEWAKSRRGSWCCPKISAGKEYYRHDK